MSTRPDTSSRHQRHERAHGCVLLTVLARSRALDWCDDLCVRTLRVLVELPVLLRYAAGSAVVAGVLGCIAGFARGLYVYPPTAWFATFEIGIPCAVAGCIVGLALGTVVLGVHKLQSSRPSR